MNASRQQVYEQEAMLRELHAVLDKLEVFVKVHEVPERTELIDLAMRLRDRTTRVLGSRSNPAQA